MAIGVRQGRRGGNVVGDHSDDKYTRAIWVEQGLAQPSQAQA